MRLYHSQIYLIIVACALFLGGCSSPEATQSLIDVTIKVDNQELLVDLPAGSTVEDAIESAGVNLGPLDRIEPQDYTLLIDGSVITVIRVSEEFEIEEVVIPYEQLRQPTELLTEGEEQMSPQQQGVNGLKEITYRIVYEDGIEISRTSIKSVIVKDTQPQIILVGVKPLGVSKSIPGKLVYLFNGSAWLMEENTTNRRPLIMSANMDGRVFELSDDGTWLLYTQNSDEDGQINSLWVANISEEVIEPIELNVANVIHFADWLPGSNSKVVFSTVEPRDTAPGWQANNDLNVLSFSESGWVSNWEENPVLETNSGGVYGWWGTDYSWSPDSQKLSYSRPDGIGVIDYSTGEITSTLKIPPLLTFGDWAWIPGTTWGPDGSIMYVNVHLPPEDSNLFDLVALPLDGRPQITLIPQSGMFAYPVTSPIQVNPSGEESYQIAFLQAIFPNQSEKSPYRLVVMDRDGSNPNVIFPLEGQTGLEPQQVVWSPIPWSEGSGFAIAIIYEGNIWLIDSTNGDAFPITGDGSISKLTWILN